MRLKHVLLKQFSTGGTLLRFRQLLKPNWAFKFALFSCIVLFQNNVEALSSNNNNNDLNPGSFIRAEGVNKSYPKTWMKKLFSSVPEREYALEDVTLSLVEKEMTLLVGASASGKSTLLRVLAQIDAPTDGTIQCTNDATAVILDRKPDYDDSLSILDRICQIGIKSTAADFKSDSDLREQSNQFCSILDLEKIMDQKPSTLTPSQQFSFGIACACIQSVASCSDTNDKPILFLDELFDFEHSSVATKVSQSLQRLSNEGAIIVISTHKPQQVEAWCQRKITMNAGKILIDEKNK